MFNKNNKYKYLFIIILLVIVSFIFTNKIYAASLSIFPSSSTVSVGNIVSVKVVVNTNGKSINNGEATIQFPVDMLEVVSITNGSSIFTLWVEEPKFSNTTGKISFNGGVPNPGFNGASGYIATFTFKAKKQGLASVIFTDAAVRENDGLGTDILSVKNGSSLKIEAPKVIEEPKIITPITPIRKVEDVPVPENKIEIPSDILIPVDTNIVPININETINKESNSLNEESNIYSLYAIIVLILVFLLLISLFFLYLGWHKFFKLKEKMNKII